MPHERGVQALRRHTDAGAVRAALAQHIPAHLHPQVGGGGRRASPAAWAAREVPSHHVCAPPLPSHTAAPAPYPTTTTTTTATTTTAATTAAAAAAAAATTTTTTHVRAHTHMHSGDARGAAGRCLAETEGARTMRVPTPRTTRTGKSRQQGRGSAALTT